MSFPLSYSVYDTKNPTHDMFATYTAFHYTYAMQGRGQDWWGGGAKVANKWRGPYYTSNFHVIMLLQKKPKYATVLYAVTESDKSVAFSGSFPLYIDIWAIGWPCHPVPLNAQLGNSA